MNPTNQEKPYYRNDSGTTIYGSNRPGHSAWQLFDSALAGHIKPESQESQDNFEEDDTGGTFTGFIKSIFIAIPLSFVLFIVMFHIIGLPSFLCFIVCLAVLFGYPTLKYGSWKNSVSAKKDKELRKSLSFERAKSLYVDIATRARTGDIDNSLPNNIRSWALGALGEEKVGEILESLGSSYEVSHDVTILDSYTGKEVANIDHIVSSTGGIIMVDAKRWTGTTTVDESTQEITSGNNKNDEYRRKAIHSLQQESQSLNVPLRAVVVAVDGGKVKGLYQNQTTNGIARILNDDSFDTYIVETSLLKEVIELLSDSNSQVTPLPEIEKLALSQGSVINF